MAARARDESWDCLRATTDWLREAALLVAREDFRIVHANLSAEELLGDRELIGRGLGALLADPPLEAEVHQRLEKSLQAREILDLGTLRLIARGGRPLLVRCAGLPVAQPGAGWLVLVRPVASTSVHAHRRAMAQRMAVAARLAGDAAHRTRNLATAITVAQQSLEDLASEGDAAQDLESLRSAIEQREGLVERFLAFCRTPWTPTDRFDLAELVGEVTELVGSCLPAAITLSAAACDRRADGDKLTVQGDLELVRQAVLGVVLALRRRLLKGGTLGVAVEPATSEPDAEHAGAATVLLSAAPITAPLPGLAAELETEAKLLAQLDGELEVERGGAQRTLGADRAPTAQTVRLTLPLARPGAASDSLRGDGRRLVLVAANTYVSQLLASSLRTASYEVEHVTGVVQLKRLLKSGPPDLVLLDDSAGAVARLHQCLPPRTPCLILLDEEPSASIPPVSSWIMVAQRPFSLTDLPRWVGRLLQGGR